MSINRHESERPFSKVVRLVPVLALVATGCTPSTEGFGVAKTIEKAVGCVVFKRPVQTSGLLLGMITPERLNLGVGINDRVYTFESQGEHAKKINQEIYQGDQVKVSILITEVFDLKADKAAIEQKLSDRITQLMNKEVIPLEENTSRITNLGACPPAYHFVKSQP